MATKRRLSRAHAEALANASRKYWANVKNRETASKRQMGENNGSWKGDKVKYAGLHMWVRARLPKPDVCDICRKDPPRDLANKGVYDRDLQNWEWLCRRCHMWSDGRMTQLIENGLKNKVPDQKCKWCGKVFTPFSNKRIHCSQSCSTTAYNFRRWHPEEAASLEREGKDWKL